MRFVFRTASVMIAAAVFSCAPAVVHAAAIRPLSLVSSLAAGDDQTTGGINFGFSVNFGGITYSTLAVNTNGNLSFGDGGFGRSTPESLATTGRVLIAPFWADIDTRGSGTVQYSNATVSGRQVFAVNYLNVGHYLASTGGTNSFQVLLFNRADTGAGNFDTEFNYDRIAWETGDDDGGVNGRGGTSAVAGFTSALGTTQLAGSLVNGAFIDGGARSLVANSLGNIDPAAGRYDFSIRNGSAVEAVPEPKTTALAGLGLVSALVLAYRRRICS